MSAESEDRALDRAVTHLGLAGVIAVVAVVFFLIGACSRGDTVSCGGQTMKSGDRCGGYKSTSQSNSYDEELAWKNNPWRMIIPGGVVVLCVVWAGATLAVTRRVVLREVEQSRE
ncbi:hypothetical protein ACFVUS_27930 [Nocardia sp. NPDC058058]|uniref:hypothetical protein n=1 Tax=Nocardia sp. NPDC058058 TaxID=3346317 RepID=UPI0036DD12EE